MQPNPETTQRHTQPGRTGERLLHPLPQMTTFELRELRRVLEETLATETVPRCARSRGELSDQLAGVIAEQDERERIRHASS
jgi:hypothetical protein